MTMISILSLARRKGVYPTKADVENIDENTKDLFNNSIKHELILPGNAEFEESIMDIYNSIIERNHVAPYPEMEDILEELDFINTKIIESYSQKRKVSSLDFQTLLAVESEFLIAYIDDIFYRKKKIYYWSSHLIYPLPRFELKERISDGI